MAVTAAVAALVSSAVAAQDNGASMNTWPYAPSTAAPVLAAVGDIACEPPSANDPGAAAAYQCNGSASPLGKNGEFATADQIESMQPDLVALLGDEQYQVGTQADFAQSFDQSYGAFKFLERPAPGNHEYYAYKKSGGENEPAQNGNGYFGYFNGRDMGGNIRPQGQAGTDSANTQGWYSYNLGAWHVISLNAECNSDTFGHSCDPTQGLLAQETQWLASDLAANHATCTVAYWHQPTFTATGSTSPTDNRFASAEGQAADAWWRLLYQHGADLVLNGHEHVYARFKPQDPAGNVDTHKGVVQFTVGTGGEALDMLAPSPNVATAQDQAFGVLKLTLGDNGYGWNYTTALNRDGTTSPTFTDAGSGMCHGPTNQGAGKG